MKKILLLIAVAFTGLIARAQTDSLKLKNALIVSHMNDMEDRYSLEVSLAQILSDCKVKNMLSLNLIREGGDPQILMTDSVTRILSDKGINTLMVVSVRGYDRVYKPSERKITLAEDLAAENLFKLYKEDIVSVTLEFHFYRNGVLVGTDLIKIGGINSREDVVKKLRKKLPKRILKKWK